MPHVPDLVDECTVQLLKEFDGQKLIFTTKVMKDLLGHKVARVSDTERACRQLAERNACLDLCTSSRP